jgi:hypothetical protein
MLYALLGKIREHALDNLLDLLLIRREQNGNAEVLGGHLLCEVEPQITLFILISEIMHWCILAEMDSNPPVPLATPIQIRVSVKEHIGGDAQIGFSYSSDNIKISCINRMVSANILNTQIPSVFFKH